YRGRGAATRNIVDCVVALFGRRDNLYPRRLQVKDGLLDMVHFGDGDPKGRPGGRFNGIRGNGCRSFFLYDDTVYPGAFRGPDNGPKITNIRKLVQQEEQGDLVLFQDLFY